MLKPTNAAIPCCPAAHCFQVACCSQSSHSLLCWTACFQWCHCSGNNHMHVAMCTQPHAPYASACMAVHWDCTHVHPNQGAHACASLTWAAPFQLGARHTHSSRPATVAVQAASHCWIPAVGVHLALAADDRAVKLFGAAALVVMQLIGHWHAVSVAAYIWSDTCRSRYASA